MNRTDMERITPLATATLVTLAALGPILILARWIEIQYYEAVSGFVEVITFGPFLLLFTILLFGSIAGVWFFVFVVTEKIIETVNIISTQE